MIILTGQPKSWINNHLKSAGFSKEEIFVDSVAHKEVFKYLNAADFAFSLIKKHKYSYACSPVKNGEYWACGLPVLIPEGIGDDSQILKETGLGVVIEDMDHPEKYFKQLEELINANKRHEIRQLAVKYRNPETTRKAYEVLIEKLITEKLKAG